MNELQDSRDQIDDFMAHHPQSPLSWEQREAFSGLDYYDDDDALTFTAPVERFSDNEPLVEMETSTGDRRLYRRWGRFQLIQMVPIFSCRSEMQQAVKKLTGPAVTWTIIAPVYSPFRIPRLRLTLILLTILIVLITLITAAHCLRWKIGSRRLSGRGKRSLSCPILQIR